MTVQEFVPFHNYHIKFRLADGEELSGAVTFRPTIEANKPLTIYNFVPTKNMIEWKKAHDNNDQDKINNLQEDIDISNVVWAERLPY